MSTAITIRKPSGALSLADNDQWQNRFQIRSESSNRVYVIAQNKKSLKWGCTCPAYLTRRYCKHLLDGCGLSPSQIHGNGQLAARCRLCRMMSSCWAAWITCATKGMLVLATLGIRLKMLSLSPCRFFSRAKKNSGVTMFNSKALQHVVGDGIPNTHVKTVRGHGAIIAAGPITKQPGTCAGRVVLVNTEGKLVVWEQTFPQYPALHIYDFGYGAYFPPTELHFAVECFANRLAASAAAIESIYTEHSITP